MSNLRVVDQYQAMDHLVPGGTEKKNYFEKQSHLLVALVAKFFVKMFLSVWMCFCNSLTITVSIPAGSVCQVTDRGNSKLLSLVYVPYWKMCW